MPIFVYIDHRDGILKKASYEALAYGSALASRLGTTASALVIGPMSGEQLQALGRYGMQKVWHAQDPELADFDASVFALIILQAIERMEADILVFHHNYHGRSLAPVLAAKLKAGLVSGVLSLPEEGPEFTVSKAVFSGKAFARIAIHTPRKVLTIAPNIFHAAPGEGQAEVEPLSFQIPAGKRRVRILSRQVQQQGIALSDARIIVSGGRGLKGPEHWGILEELASVLGAATACSRPVAEAGWRPHQEHVGQTGLTVRPDLYIAIGISGAIQHLAGVNGSKYIVVINTDPEAPFFQAADYGIVGNAFQVVPELTAAIRTFQETHHS